MGWRIRFTKGPLEGREFTVGATAVKVGRSRSCDIRVPNAAECQDVSREHLLLIGGGTLAVVNLSTHTTEVDGVALPGKGKRELAVGSSIRMGRSTAFTVVAKPDAQAVGLDDEVCVFDEGTSPLSAASLSAGEKTRATMTSSPAQTPFAPFGGTDAGERTRATMTSSPAQTPFAPFGGADAGEKTRATMTSSPARTPFAPFVEAAVQGAATGDAATGDVATGARAGVEGGEDEQFVAEEAPGESGTATGVGTRATAASAEADTPKTAAFGTVIVSPEELQKLIVENRKARNLRVYKRIAFFVGGFIAFAVLYFWLRPRPETVLTWPLNSAGQYDDANLVLDSPLGEGAVKALCPKDRRLTVTSGGTNVTVVETRLGRARDVPLRLTLICEEAAANLLKSRLQLFQEKKASLEEGGGWNFLSVAPPAFLGPDNGVPCHEVQYLRSERDGDATAQWFGHLLFAVHGDCALTFLREIPASEQWRGAPVLARETMLLFDDDVIVTHWEGGPDCRDDPAEDMLSEVDGLLALNSPMLWREAEFLLRSVLVKCGGEGEVAEQALKRLRKLRAAQKTEFNRLRAQAQSEEAGGVKREDTAAMAEAVRVFSSTDDRRNDLVRKGRWK